MNFLSSATEIDRKEFFIAVKNGSIELNALYAGVLTGICRPEEFYRLTDYARKLAVENDIKFSCAMASDIPGFTWNIVPALAHSGIRYFTSARILCRAFLTQVTALAVQIMPGAISRFTGFLPPDRKKYCSGWLVRFIPGFIHGH